MMKSTSSRYPSPPSPPSRLPSTLPISPKESIDGIDIEKGLRTAVSRSAESHVEVEDYDLLTGSDLTSSSYQVDEATRQHSRPLKASVAALPNLDENTPSLPISTSTTGHLRPRRGSVASVASLTLSEKALLSQTFWSFSWQYLTDIKGLLTRLPTLQFSRGARRPINAQGCGASEERRVEWRAYGDRIQKAKLGLWE